MAKKKSLKDYTELGNMSASVVLKNFPFVLFLGFLAMIYIANAHYSEKKVRQIRKLRSEVKDLRWDYISLKSDMMYNTKQSKVIEEVAPLGLELKANKVKKILIPDDYRVDAYSE